MPRTLGGIGTATHSPAPGPVGRRARRVTRRLSGAAAGLYQPVKQEKRAYRARLTALPGAAHGRRSRRAWKPWAAAASGPREK